MTLSRVCFTVALSAMLVPAAADAADKARKPTAPETLTATAHVTGTTGSAATRITMQIDRYSTDADRDAVAQALKDGGYDAFLVALRKAPVVGTVSLADQKFDIRWARQEPVANRRTVVLVTDKPVYFVGGGSATAKPREGYDVAVLQFDVDDSGMGYSGTMAAAARVKPGGATGVEIDDYSEKPITLQSIRRVIK